MVKLLVAEDDTRLAASYGSVLERAGFEVVLASNGEEALEMMDRHFVDLLITDIMMPHMDGFQLSRYLREAGYSVPILVISAKSAFQDKKRGFQNGVDDYMIKPIDVNEMVLRVEALLRRAKIAHSQELRIGNTRLDERTMLLVYRNEEHLLPQKEFKLLYKLLSYPNKIFTRQQLMDEIWGMESETDERTIDVHIKRLRDKFEQVDDFKIRTIRGLGYKAVLNSETENLF